MKRLLRLLRISVVLNVLVGAGLAVSGFSQTMPSPQPVSLPHLYWHFLIHLHDMEARASAEEKAGRDGTWFRTHLKTSLGFSDSEYAALRESSNRLNDRLKVLNDQASSIKQEPPSSDNIAKLQQLTAERETAIQSEIASLRLTLPPNKIQSLETFMTQFLAPKVAVHP